MRIYIVNLDRNPMRWERMANLLAGLDFKRIPAVDGKTLDGPEYNDHSHPRSCEKLSRYNRACILSHRLAYQEFLAGKDPYCCILEDDAFIKPDFHRFVTDESWIPAGSDLLKLETANQEVYVGIRKIRRFGRVLVRLDSLHYGASGYIISRRAAQVLLETTLAPDRAIDIIIFDEAGLKKLHPVYQVIPAVCIQANQLPDGVIFPELNSNIQRPLPPKAPTPVPVKRPFDKARRELTRPILQLVQKIKFAALWLRGQRRCRVPWA